MKTTRFAPSPTGYLHVGNLRTALFNYLLTLQAGGTFILRIDDTDPDRSRPEYVDAIQRDLEWLGIEWDRMERQSARLDAYDAAAEKLRTDGRLYEAFDTPTELDLKRKKQLNMGKPPVYDRSALALGEAERAAKRAQGPGHWRFQLDHARIHWNDGIIGDVSIDAASVSDPVLIRGDGQYLYTLASVVDDLEMEITHVVRGSDHVTNTATQIQIMAAFGGSPPHFSHHSLLTGAKGEALSKRLGTLALRDLREAGVEPLALLSLLARIGSSQPVELCTSIKELAEGFDLKSFGTAPTKLDINDVYPLTSRYLRALPLASVKDAVAGAGVPEEMAEPFWHVVRDNIVTLHDLGEWWHLISQGVRPVVDEADCAFVEQAMTLFPQGEVTQETWTQWTNAVKAATGRKGRALFMPLRKALTGQSHGPDMAALLPLLQNIPGRKS